MTKNSDTSPWMHFPNDPKAIKRHNELVLSSIPTADLIAELSKRNGVLQLHPDDAVRDLNEILWNFNRNRQPKPKILVVRE